ncbi:MAG: ABC transporter ATP-binding protein [Pseudonocardia sp. SCN 72-86]|nr:MAG: ABC transporter ATP-binding protein [Pseudonocardia sp. SCN 72-86]
MDGTQGGALEVRDIEVRFQRSILVLHEVALRVEPGEVVALLGSNGAGKTTTLKAISGLLAGEDGHVTRGEILFDGNRIDGVDPTRIVRDGLVQVLEGRRVLQHLTVEQNLVVASATRRTPRAQLAEDLAGVYELFPILADFRKRPAGYLSGGQQQMVVLGRALMSHPRLLLLDEPSLGLAPKTTDEIFAAILDVNRSRRMSVLLVEQNARVALEIADRGYVLETGRVVLEGPADALRDNPDLREFYLGVGASGARNSFRNVKHYRREKNWSR